MMFWVGCWARPSSSGGVTGAPTPPLETGTSAPFAAIWNGSTSFASVTLLSGGGVKVSRKASRDVEEISNWDGERPTGSVVVAAKSGVRTPSGRMLKTVMVGAIEPVWPWTSSPRLTT